MLPAVKVYAGYHLIPFRDPIVLWQPFSSWFGLAAMPSFKQPLFLRAFLCCFSAGWMCDSVAPPLRCRYLSFSVVSEFLFIPTYKPDKFFLLSSFNSVSTLANAASNNRLIIISHFLPLCIKYKLIRYITCPLSYSRIWFYTFFWWHGSLTVQVHKNKFMLLYWMLMPHNLEYIDACMAVPYSWSQYLYLQNT